MKKTNNRSTKEYFSSAIKASGERLLHNTSKGEQALFVCAVVLSFAALVLSAVMAIISGDAMTIVRAFTENIVWFAFVVALTVSDRFLVLRGRSLILILYTLLALVRDGFAFSGASGIGMALAVIGMLAGIAFYGTLLIDQFNGSDTPIKYWLVYGGALYKLLYELVRVIVDGTAASQLGVVNVLSVIASGFAAVALVLMLVYQFDGFSFIKYFIAEITSEEEQDLDEAYDDPTPQDETVETSEDDSYFAYDDQPASQAEEVSAVEETAEELDVDDAEEQPAQADESVEDEEVIDDFGYVPYDDGMESDAVDNSVKPLTADTPEPCEKDAEQEAYEAYDESLDDQDVLVDDSVAEQQVVIVSAKEAYDALTPVERKYASFAISHRMPEETLQVEGLSGDMFDVWINGETICFLNDLDQASDGRGVRTAVIPFEDVQSIGISSGRGDEECIVLSYLKDGDTIEIGFKKSSFGNFKKVMLSSDDQ